MPFPRRPVLFRFLVLFVCALVPLVLVGVLDLPDSKNLQDIAKRTANEYDRLIQLRERQVFSIAAFPSIRAFTSSTPDTRSQRAAVASNELQAWVAADTTIRQALITDSVGIVIMSTLEGWNSDISSRKFVQEALQGQLAVSPITRDGGESSTFYAAPILNNSGAVAGTLILRVAAQELWSVTSKGDAFYAILTDQNGVRLDDSGDNSRRLASFAPLETTQLQTIVNEQTYGAELLQPRATNLTRAQELVSKGAVDQLSGRDLGANALAVQRLVSKPWYVLVLSPEPAFGGILARLVIPVAVALVLALGGAYLLMRL